jgi:5,10-methenyltetrahydrofolate synthetase
MHRDDLPADSAVIRAKLRREKIAARQAMPAEQRHNAETRIHRRILDLLHDHPAGVIAYCWPIRAEVDCRPVIDTLLAAGWQAAMPVVAQTDAPMNFRAWAPQTPMVADPYGIPIPQPEVCLRPDVVLVPLVAFDADRFRLGYGGGYFDRTLANLQHRPLTIGVGFALAEAPSIRPESHDLPMDIIVTETTTLFGKMP